MNERLFSRSRDRLVAEYHASGRMISTYEQLQSRDGVSNETATSLTAERNERRRLRGRLSGKFEEAIAGGRGVFRGVSKDASDLGRSTADIFRGLFDFAVPNLYPKLEMGSPRLSGKEAEEVLRASNLQGLSPVFYDGDEGLGLVMPEGARYVPNPSAEISKEVLDYLKGEHAYGNKVTGKILEERFGGMPYGWDRDVLKMVLAVLLRAGSIEVTYQGRRFRNHLDPQCRTPFATTSAFRAASFAPREAIDLKTLINAVKQYEGLTGDEVDVEEGALSAAFKKLADEEMGLLLPVISDARANRLPVLDALEDYRNTLQVVRDAASDVLVSTSVIEVGIDVPNATVMLIEGADRDEEHREMLRGLGLRSYIVVPLLARGRSLGAISLVAAESGRVYGTADLEFARELARRAALAVDNAKLFEEAGREISERRRAQEELRASRDQLEFILLGVADGITAQDPTGRVVYANGVAAGLVGYPSAREFMEAPAREVLAGFEVFDEEGRRLSVENLPGRKALAGEEGTEMVLRFRVLRTGEERWALVRAAPVFDERGRVSLAVNIFRDVTESRRAEESLRRVREAERTRMARDLHDGVLQDLSYTAAAIGVMMLQAEDTKLEGQLQGIIDAVRRAAQGLRHAVHDLRIEEELDRPFPELVEYLVRRNRTMARGYEIGLEVEPCFPQYPLGETGTQLWRVLQEALTNARRHSRARRVSVVLRTEGEDLIAEVFDDGRGFGTEAVPGVGQGSMRERAAAVGGELEIESEPGGGTTVRLRAPLPREVNK